MTSLRFRRLFKPARRKLGELVYFASHRLLGNPQGTSARACAEYIDLCDIGAVADAARRPIRAIHWDQQPLDSVPDKRAAARVILDLLRRRRDLRARFPNALSEGGNSTFLSWLRAEFALPPETLLAIEEAFGADLSAKARQVALYDETLRARHPLFLLPQGRPALIRTLFKAVTKGALAREDAWWMLMESAEDPARELVHTWQFTPDWQRRFPDGITLFGQDRFARWIAETFAIADDWLDPFGWPLPLTDAEQIRVAYLANKNWRDRFPEALSSPDEAAAFVRFLATTDSGLSAPLRTWCAGCDPDLLSPALTSSGVNLFGHFSYPSGLRTSIESIVSGLHASCIATSLRDVRVNARTDEPVHHKFAGLELFDTSIIHVQPEPFFENAVSRSGLQEGSPRRYRIGYWYWEFDTIPASWDKAAASCDELWTATSFIAHGLRARYRHPVHVFMPGLELPEIHSLPQDRFDLPKDSFVFLFTFHMASVMERKNPLGLIAAFRRAFDSSDNADLVIKTSFGTQHSSELCRLHAAAEGLRVRIIDDVFDREETLGLIAMADAYVSLHRSEGLGLTMAEAMLLGKPVIATGYSGNLDFMNDRNSLLVAYKMVALGKDCPPYEAGLRWAEPSIDDAARLMRRLYENRYFGKELGTRARADLGPKLMYANAGNRMAERLAEIAYSRRNVV